MTFKYVREGTETSIVDAENGVILKKKMGGQDFIIFELSNEHGVFQISADIIFHDQGRTWKICNIQYPDGFRGDLEAVKKEVEGLLNTYKNLAFERTSSSISISLGM